MRDEDDESKGLVTSIERFINESQLPRRMRLIAISQLLLARKYIFESEVFLGPDVSPLDWTHSFSEKISNPKSDIASRIVRSDIAGRTIKSKISYRDATEGRVGRNINSDIYLYKLECDCCIHAEEVTRVFFRRKRTSIYRKSGLACATADNSLLIFFENESDRKKSITKISLPNDWFSKSDQERIKEKDLLGAKVHIGINSTIKTLHADFMLQHWLASIDYFTWETQIR
ncbi:hypothetical protein [Maricaulis alexandrii]|uniref:hypothetical protein n=1 Tax=Maricaulis alexandrii TaxID=2570354 RepID=UPI001108A7DD|nr:hypothetical protein [Maricaulis alexandrii]